MSTAFRRCAVSWTSPQAILPVRHSSEAIDMRVKGLMWLLLVVISVTGTHSSAEGQGPPVPNAASQQRGMRRVPAQPDVPILSLLAPDDVVLTVIESTLVGATPGLPPGTELIELMTKSSQYVALVTVSSLNARLSGDAKWVETHVVMRPVEVFKPIGATGDAAVNGMIRGGELTVGPQTVRALRAGSSPLRTGQTYLIFVETQSGNFMRLNPINVFSVDGSVLTPLVDNPVFGKLPEKGEALRQVANAARQEVPR